MYELAFSLGKSVNEIADDMPYEELLGWFNYFERRPVGWREDLRTYQLLSAEGVKKKPEAIFPSLQAILHPPSGKKPDGMIDPNNLKKSFIFQKILSAKGGDTINFKD